MNKTFLRLGTSLTIAATAFVATPAFAAESGDASNLPLYRNRLNSRAITSRAIRSNRNQNRPDVGNIRVNGLERTAATPAVLNGRSYLPVRGVWRHPGLRNRNRHVLGRQRQGHWKILNTEQGDDRRTPEVATKNTARDFLFPNWRRWARGRNDTGGLRDLNRFNRPEIEE